VSSNVAQSYPYSSETEAERAAAVAAAIATDATLAERLAAETTALGEVVPAENGAPPRWWTWVCPKDVRGRLHVAGYALERHALYTICDTCGSTFLR
jgi:hypothetical protein